MFPSEDKKSKQRAKQEAKEKSHQMERIRREEVSKIIVTTGDLKRDYDVVGPVFFEYSSSKIDSTLRKFWGKYKNELKNGDVYPEGSWENLYGKHCQNMERHEKAFYVGVEQLKERAYLLGGDAVICMKKESGLYHNGLIYFLYIHFFGTVVKFKKTEVFE